jgi:Na+-transporting methylmalonyl-CoA/oxaloacetate decarboxylase gamma subunit
MDNLGWGLQITALGMGLVFSLLAVLWGLLVLVLKLDGPPVQPAAFDAAGAAPAALPAADADAPPAPPEPAVPDPARDPALLAAIGAAVLAHRALRRSEAAPGMRTHWPGSLLHASRWVSSGRLRQNRTFHKGR